MDKIKSLSKWTRYNHGRNGQDKITVGMDKVKLLSKVTCNNYGWNGQDKSRQELKKKIQPRSEWTV